MSKQKKRISGTKSQEKNPFLPKKELVLGEDQLPCVYVEQFRTNLVNQFVT